MYSNMMPGTGLCWVGRMPNKEHWSPCRHRDISPSVGRCHIQSHDHL